MVLLVDILLGGRVLTWTGFAHFDHGQASATPSAHAILPLRGRRLSYLLEAQPHAAVREKPAKHLRARQRCHESLRHIHLVVVGGLLQKGHD